jgi:DnaJ homolog subfamily A member 5
VFNIYPFFSPSCFRGYGDDDKGFYAVYKELFIQLANEDRDFYEEGLSIPEFGQSDSDYDEVVAPFYSFWMSYCTPRSFVWCEEHDTREATHRQVRRAMEKENKKLRDKAKKERNETVRKLVSLIKKKDKRVEAQRIIAEQKAQEVQQKLKEKREADRLRQIEQVKNYVEPEWSKTAEEKLMRDKKKKSKINTLSKKIKTFQFY